nr:D-isomer specific 2-hydroxyacid dehydrogenase family protein [Amycolatopsis saalfeldensis]
MPAAGVTVYGCEADEAALFREVAARWGVPLVITAETLGKANVDLVAGNRCVSVGHKTRIANSALLALSRAGVRYVSTRSVGYDHIDGEYARSVGISVEGVAYSPDSVADYTVLLMLMSVRNTKATLRRAELHDYRLAAARGKELRDLTVGVIGTGRIGAAVIDRLRGFGCGVLAYDRRPRSSADYVPLDELLQLSDIVTLHTPLDERTHHLLDRSRIAQLKDGAVVVNTGRGALIETGALLAALESGRLGGAALDVLEGEEGDFYADCRGKIGKNETLARLQRMSNVLISPHTAYYTDHALRDIVENSLINCLKFESGDKA